MKLRDLERAFDLIKGCYEAESLIDLAVANVPKRQPSLLKISELRSSPSIDDPDTKKPHFTVTIEYYRPENILASIEIIVNSETFSAKKDDIRGRGVYDKAGLDSSDAISTATTRQQFSAIGSRKTQLRLMFNESIDGSGGYGAYYAVLKPVERNCF